MEGPWLHGQLTAYTTDSVHGIDEVLSYGYQHSRIEELDELGYRMRDVVMPPLVFKNLRYGADLVLTLVSAASVVWTGVSAHLDPLLMAALAAMSLRLFEGPRDVEDTVRCLDYLLSMARRLQELYRTSEAVLDSPRELRLDAPPNIGWCDANYRYPGTMPGNLALSGVSMTTAMGGRTVFVGAGGLGKSTATQLLFRYDELTGDDILIDGISVCEYTLDSLRRAVALMPQRGQVLDATIVENPQLGTPDVTDENLWHALVIAGSAGEARVMPHSLTTRTGCDGRGPSGGQLQRLYLAGALLVNPRVLVLGKLTANLNADLEARTRTNLERDLPGLTIIEITHRLEHLDSASRAFEFGRGRVAARVVPW